MESQQSLLTSLVGFSHRRSFTVLLCFVVVALSIIKSPTALFPPQFWAEEFSIFYVDAHTLGAASLFKTYAGYLHLLPRLIALALTWVPFELTPLSYKIASMTILFGLGLIVTFLRLPLEVYQRNLMVLMLVLIPVGGEVYFNLANSITLAGAGVLLLFIQEPAQRRSRQLFEWILLYVLGLTGAFLIFLFPLVAFRLWWTDLRKGIWYRFTTLVAITIVNFIFYVPAGRFNTPIARDPQVWFNAVLKFLRCFTVASLASSESAFDMLGILTLAVIMTVVFLGIREQGRRFFFANESTFLVLCGLTVWVASLWAFKYRPDILTPNANGDRYFYIPYLFLSYALVIVRSKSGHTRKLLSPTICLTLISSMICIRSNKQIPDLHFQEQLQDLREGKTTVLRFPPDWQAEVKDMAIKF